MYRQMWESNRDRRSTKSNVAACTVQLHNLAANILLYLKI